VREYCISTLVCFIRCFFSNLVSALPLKLLYGYIIDVWVEALQVIQNILPTLGHGSTTKILSAVSPIYISAELDMRLRICDLLDALVASDASILSVVIPVLLSPLIHA